MTRHWNTTHARWAAATALATLAAGAALFAQQTGPTSSATPYVLPTLPTSVVSTASLLTVGDTIGGYKMSGLADGLGAFDNGDGTFTLLMNHELGSTAGVVRSHGAKGAFVSKWILDKGSLGVVSGADLIQEVYLWDTANQRSNVSPTPGVAFNRFCSADLPAQTAFYNPATGRGSRQRIFMHGEEGGAMGYQMATVVTGADAGRSYVLGKFNLTTNGSGLTGVGAWENALASPAAQDKTIVMGMNDGGTGIMNNAVAVYVGTKQASGSEVEKAGLMNGTQKFVSVTANPLEVVDTTTRATNIVSGTRFSLSATSSTTFSRPEDGAWDPQHPNVFYFVTTDRLDQATDGVGAQVGQTRLWRLRFDDITNPDLGGTIDLVIDGRVVNGEKINMLDNIAINERNGLIILQEDTGTAVRNGKLWAYDPSTDVLVRIAKHDPARFGDLLGGVVTASTAPFTNDEETSGVIDVSSILGPGTYLLVDQAHYATGNPDTVEGGQLLAMRVALPVVKHKDTCKNAGWQDVFRLDGTPFRNQGCCVSYTNTGR